MWLKGLSTERSPGKFTSCLLEEECEEEVGSSSGSPPEISSKIVFEEVSVPLLRTPAPPLNRRRAGLPPES